MKKIIVRKKAEYLMASCVLSLTVISGCAFVFGTNSKKDYRACKPCAGAAQLISSNSSIEPQMLAGGIGKTIVDYNNTLDDNKKSTIVKVDKAMSFAANPEPQNQDAQPEQQPEQPVTSVIDGYTVLGVANVENYLNVRETPSEDGAVLGKLPMNAGCEITETLDGWYKITSGELSGYVSSQYLLTGAEANERALSAMSLVAHVNADKLMVREQPNTDCDILTRVAENEELEVAEQLDGWVKVNIDDVTGYVASEFVSVYKTLPKGVTLEQITEGTAEEKGYSSTAVDVIEYAKQFLGNPYVWGGTSLTNGTDCSGFTMRIYEHFGYGLSRTSREQANNGTRVSLDEMQPGEYIGNGQIIHASTERTGIIIGNAFYTTPACATRILN